jgi:Glycosyl hydrolase family 26
LRWLIGICAVVLVVLVTGCSSPKPAPTLSPNPTRYLGVAGVSTVGLQNFEQATGVQPGIVEIYTTFGTPLESAQLTAIVQGGARPLIQLEPYRISMAAIAAGRYDAYLRHYAVDLGQLGRAVILSFAPEANGYWYSWGCPDTSAAVFVAAWRHVHDVIARYDKRVTWLWDVNQSFPKSCPLMARWPGAVYVDWVGVDGYLWYANLTFNIVFTPTIVSLRGSTRKPVLIAETGVLKMPQASAQLEGIFAGAKAIPGVIGIVYSNYATAKHDYRLEQNPSALKTFRSEAKSYATN